MDLWIRSQNKTLLEKTDGIVLNNKGFEIYSTKNGRIFGRYKSKERALEVLNDIQNFKNLLNHFEIFKNDESRFNITTDLLIKYHGSTIYEMPEE